MNPTWRYFDYDYDNNCIIMTDESDENMGWVSSGKQEPFHRDTEQKEPAKYPMDTVTVHDRSRSVHASAITTSAQSNISNQSRQSHASNISEAMINSPPPMMAQVHPNKVISKPDGHGIVYRSNTNTKPTQHIHNIHRHNVMSSGYVTRHQSKEKVLTLNTAIPGVSPSKSSGPGLTDHALLKRKQPKIHSAEYNQYLYQYHYHYFQGLMEFQRIAATKQF